MKEELCSFLLYCKNPRGLLPGDLETWELIFRDAKSGRVAHRYKGGKLEAEK